ncbi:ATP-binding protein [Methanoregula sp.]|uniref:ATP-binding protein n=1 Tax=Methanoregula sp. TaxID=2052170 RepID=UPI00236EAD07|nr:ATP-binding protein [Methanoregula sp.]MDD1685785.1 ATP-binding protein [Methanoregula sp.]
MPEQSQSLTIPSDLEEIAKVSDALESLMLDQEFPGEDILDTQLAVEEAVTNIIVHGYENTVGDIVITCRAGPDEISIQLEDRAVPFNPLLMPEPDLEQNIEEREIGGLGIFLARQIMSDIQYRFEDGKNILTMIKKKSVPEKNE